MFRTPGVVADLVADLDPALLQDGLGERGGRVAAGAPGGGGEHRVPVPADGPYLAAGMLDPHRVVAEDLAQELPHVGGVDPGGSQPGADLSRCQPGGDDLAQLGDVDVVARVVRGSPLGGFELVAHPAGQVLRGRDAGGRSRVIEDQGAEFAAGLFLADAEQPGDSFQLHLAADVQADRQRVGRGCRRPGGGCGERRRAR